MPREKVRVALYGMYGHQIHNALVNNPLGQLVAVAGIKREQLPEALRGDASIRFADSLQQLMADPQVDLISLCSPCREAQAREAIACLEAGKHVYAEKPAAMTEPELDAILAAVARTGKQFREMANGIAETQPYMGLRRLIERGDLGTIVQVFAQKSYPYHNDRPQDENIDGGLILQNGGHALRMIEQVASQRIASIEAIETTRGNPHSGYLQMASAMNMRLEGGGIATAIANYLNPKGFGLWGNEHLRVFGTKGMAEITDGGRQTHHYIGDRDLGPIDTSEPEQHYHDMYMKHLLGKAPMPRTLEDELHVTRMGISAFHSAKSR